MPSIELFLEGYHIKADMNFENYHIDKIEMTHHAIQRYVDYSYPYSISLSWRGSVSPSQPLVDSLKYYLYEYLKGDRIIRSYSGRPYKCTFFKIEPKWTISSDMKSITMEGQGYAHRIKESEVFDINKNNNW